MKFMLNVQGLCKLSAKLQRSVLATCTVPSLLQLAILPEALHDASLLAAYPTITSTHSLKVPNSWAASEYGSICWNVLSRQTDLQSLDCSYRFCEGHTRIIPPVPQEFFSCIEALANLKCLSIAWLDLRSHEVNTILDTLKPSILEHLDISSSILKKTMTFGVAAALGKFVGLTSLAFSMSGADTSVVKLLGESIAQLQSLQVLNIMNCSVRSSDLDQFRSQLATLTSIQAFSISGENGPDLCEGLPSTVQRLQVQKLQNSAILAPCITHLTQLTELYLAESADQSVGDLGAIVGHVSTSLLSLRVLHLTGSGMTAEGSAAVARLLPCLLSLQDLYISIEEKTVRAAEYPVDARSIAASLCRVTNLLHISLCGFHIGEKSAHALAKSLSVHTGLETLKLDNSRVNTKAADVLAAQFLHLQCLQRLHVANCLSTPWAYRATAENIGQLCSLRVLSIASSEKVPCCECCEVEPRTFAESGLRALSSQFSSLTCLERLDLANHYMGLPGISVVSESLRHLTALWHLDLSCNELDDDAIAVLAPVLGSLKLLQRLNLSGHLDFTSNAVASLAPYLTSLVFLQYLDFTANRICDRGGRMLAECVRVLPALNVIDLHRNRIDRADQLRECPYVEMVFGGLDDQDEATDSEFDCDCDL